MTSTARKNAETANTNLRRYEHNTASSNTPTLCRRYYSHHYRDAIVFEKFHFQNEKPGGVSFSNSSDYLKSVFESSV